MTNLEFLGCLAGLRNSRKWNRWASVTKSSNCCSLGHWTKKSSAICCTQVGCYLAGWPARLPDWCLQAIGWMTCTPADLHAGECARLPACCWCRCCLLAGESASHFFFGPPTELSRVNTHSDYQPWQYNNGNGMLALKTPAILRPKIEKAKQNELFPLLSNERQLF